MDRLQRLGITDPSARNNAYRSREFAQVEWTTDKVLWPDDRYQNRSSITDIETNRRNGSCSCKSNGTSQTWERKNEGEKGGKADGADWCMVFRIDSIEKGRKSTISRESKHHPGVTGEGKKSAMPDANNDEGHCCHCSFGAKNVNEDLHDRIPIARSDGCCKVLDTE